MKWVWLASDNLPPILLPTNDCNFQQTISSFVAFLVQKLFHSFFFFCFSLRFEIYFATFETCEFCCGLNVVEFGEYFVSAADLSFSTFDLVAHFLDQSRKGFRPVFCLDDRLWLSVAVRPSMKQELSRARHLSGRGRRSTLPAEIWKVKHNKILHFEIPNLIWILNKLFTYFWKSEVKEFLLKVKNVSGLKLIKRSESYVAVFSQCSHLYNILLRFSGCQVRRQFIIRDVARA